MNISEWIIEAFILSVALLAVTVSVFIIMMMVSLTIQYVERRWNGKY
tara:strand:- start:2082 stop:2222 length:141 start_codon:yes stop_codon:yes gene_type:complete